MGTRGAWGVRFKEVDKVTYNHFDSYPSELGIAVLYFARALAKTDGEKFFGKIVLVSEDVRPTPAEIEENAKLSDIAVGAQRPDDWYCLLRKSQGEPMQYLETGLRHMIDSAEFLKDSLFCEWAYIVNFDTRKLEIYRGGNRNRMAPGRYAGLGKKEDEYCGVELLAEYPLDALPSDAEMSAHEESGS